MRGYLFAFRCDAAMFSTGPQESLEENIHSLGQSKVRVWMSCDWAERAAGWTNGCKHESDDSRGQGANPVTTFGQTNNC